MELDRIYEDTDKETVTLKEALEQREFTKPKQGQKMNRNDDFEVHRQTIARGRTSQRLYKATRKDHAPERIVVQVLDKTCACGKQDTHVNTKAAFSVHSAFDLAQAETLGNQIWVPGRAIPGSGSGNAGVG